MDDFLLVEDEEAMDEAINEIKAAYSVKEMGKVQECVGCKIEVKNTDVLISQPDLNKKLEKSFGEYENALAKYNTPGPPGEGIVRPGD